MKNPVAGWVTSFVLVMGVGLVYHASARAAATPDFLATIVQPVGIAATTSNVLVSQPYCVSDSQTGVLSPDHWQIVKVDTSGTVTHWADLPANPDYGVNGTPGILSNCEESYLAISTGLGGFSAGHVFATQGGKIYEFDSGGGFVRTVATIPSIEVGFAHTGLVFDTVGTFKNNLIVVGTNGSDKGEVWIVNSAGATVDASGNPTGLPIFTLAGPGNTAACDGIHGVPCLESPDVAPTSGPLAGSIGGDLVIPLPGFSNTDNSMTGWIGELTSSLSFSAPVHLPAPEAVHFVPSQPPSCSFAFNSNSYEFFNASFSDTGNGLGGTSPGNTVFAYKTSDFSGVDHELLVTEEGAQTVISSDGSTFANFDNAIYNSEGSNFITCVPTTQCTGNLTWGYWKTHTGSGHPRQDPTYLTLGGNTATCAAVAGKSPIELDGDCDNSSDSGVYFPTDVFCAKSSTCSASADAVFAGGGLGGPNCSGNCASLFAAQFLAAQLNGRKVGCFNGATYENPSDPFFSGQTISSIFAQMESAFDNFVDGNPFSCGGQSNSFTGCQNTLDAINSSGDGGPVVLFGP
jgi:hypothetical protein